MVNLRPYRSLTKYRPLRFVFFRSYHHNHWQTMPDRKKKEKRPPLTHFLCLPLVNAASLPQLESSLATFKASIPRRPLRYGANASPEQSLIPDGALRPVGTLHLTLGVMSLPTKERLNEAIEFFRSLDLASIAREAEKVAHARIQKKMRNTPADARGVTGPDHAANSATLVSESHDKNVPSPITISLESLHALPRARAATILHAAPVDPTARLYPFCEMLRDKFLEAGFLQAEQRKEKRHEKGASVPSLQIQDLSPGEPSPLEEMSVDVAEDTARISDKPIGAQPASKQSIAPKPRIRPLLLHATVANTIYVRGRARGGGSQKGNNRRSQFTFDARDILSHYRDYYVDSDRTVPRSAVVTIAGDGAEQDQGDLEDRSDDENSHSTSESSNNKYPFVWAKGFPLEMVSICEMGAKKLDPKGDEDGMNVRLKEKYFPVEERSLDFQSPGPRT
ncbi:AKAP7 2'5' RNA ligase-like domain-containing protein [Aspergillus coremiiformis]|uniref:AKAP7 2'5' RNA ligase-like domain-containing protein n=1 Tax=Aspergillus coremiiformis TaxID=138285 RepID=A0A5N6Z637_9EURO|nr:AKAP7 2'5' RNA ligase-like domain-containing protein [Aspergillus coremiiformis]